MGCFNQAVEIGDAGMRNSEVVDALVDTGATYTIIPASILTRLGIEPADKMTIVLADGRRLELDTGYATAKIGGYEIETIVVFGADGAQPLLGAYTLEALGLGVDVANGRLIETPYLSL